MSYAYDAWGNCTQTNIGGYVIGNLNPFRYRGYYYDTETGLYYLQSRYYNPQWGRFLNADAYVNANGDLIGYNMFAYCSNNPVMFTDFSGEGFIKDWCDTRKKELRNATKWISETFGAVVYASNRFDEMKIETVYCGIEEGTSTSKIIAGNNDKPITFYATRASSWWRFSEYQAGISINSDDGGVKFGIGVLSASVTTCTNNISKEFTLGAFKTSVTTSYDVDFKNNTAGKYVHTYGRPWTIAATACAIYYTGGAVIPVLPIPMLQ